MRRWVRWCSSQTDFVGVFFVEHEMKKYQAKLEIEGQEIDGGLHWTAKEAAIAYDALARLYLGPDAATNFEPQSTPSTTMEWTPPDAIPAPTSHADLIPVHKGEYLELEHVLSALQAEQAEDIQTIDLEGKSSVGQHMIFCTGRSLQHLRRMADVIVDAIRAREMADGMTYQVEGRDCADWMIVDANTIIVHFMQADFRQSMDLESHWANMRDNCNREYGHLTEEQYMDEYGMVDVDPEDGMAPEDVDKDWQ